MKDTRERIREGALRLFIEKGYKGTSIGDIERAAGLAPRTGGFYRHFPSKADLAAEIGEKSIIESREELGLDLLPLGDTRAELLLIAKGYRRAAERQAPLAALIDEVRGVKEIRDLEDRVSRDLLEALGAWLAEKPFARNMNHTQRVALILTIIGGWIFFLSKRDSGARPADLTDDRMMDAWADLWAGILDREERDVTARG